MIGERGSSSDIFKVVERCKYCGGILCSIPDYYQSNTGDFWCNCNYLKKQDISGK